MTTFSSSLHALGAQAAADTATTDPTLITLWIGVGVLGLIAGVVTVTIAERRLRASATPATTPVAVTSPVVAQDASLLASA